MMLRKITFIINPASGHKHTKPSPAFIKNIFNESGVEADVVFSEAVGHAGSLAATAIKNGADTVVAAGGDGTVNEIASVLNGTGCVLAILPCGSGNGLARHHKIPLNAGQALQVIKRYNVVSHDSVKINGRLSFNVSGIGFDAHVAHLFGQDGKRGFNSYVKLVIKEFSKYKERKISLTQNDSQIDAHIILAAIANGSQFGNNAVIAPFADTGDGRVDITLVKKVNIPQMISLAYDVFSKKVGRSKYAQLFSGESFVIRSEDELPLHIDGEPAGYAKKFEIETIKGSLKLIVP